MSRAVRRPSRRRSVRGEAVMAEVAPALFTAALASYAANCALGTAVALRLVDTRRHRWVHHAIYIATCALAAAAGTASLLPGRSDRSARAAALVLAPAAVPLAVIPYAGTHTRRHPLIALTAAPFLAGAAVRSRR